MSGIPFSNAEESPQSRFVHLSQNKYDRSGRSTGFAFVTYENEEDAAVAQKELDGVLAKGPFRPRRWGCNMGERLLAFRRGRRRDPRQARPLLRTSQR